MEKNLYVTPVCEVEDLRMESTILVGSVEVTDLEETDLFDGGSWEVE